MNPFIDPDYKQPDGDYAYPQSQTFGEPTLSSLPKWERLPHSLYGILSFVLALVAVMGCFVMLCINAYIDVDETLVGLFFLASCFSAMCALAFGIIGLCEPRTKKIFAVCGIVFASIFLLSAAGILGIGILVELGILAE